MSNPIVSIPLANFMATAMTATKAAQPLDDDGYEYDRNEKEELDSRLETEYMNSLGDQS